MGKVEIGFEVSSSQDACGCTCLQTCGWSREETWRPYLPSSTYRNFHSSVTPGLAFQSSAAAWKAKGKVIRWPHFISEIFLLQPPTVLSDLGLKVLKHCIRDFFAAPGNPMLLFWSYRKPMKWGLKSSIIQNSTSNLPTRYWNLNHDSSPVGLVADSPAQNTLLPSWNGSGRLSTEYTDPSQAAPHHSGRLELHMTPVQQAIAGTDLVQHRSVIARL